MDELYDYLQMILKYAEKNSKKMNAASQKALAEFIANLIQFIEEEERLISEESVTSKPEIPPGEYPSSNVNGFKYDPKNQEMLVQFHGPYPQAAGPIYRYSGVPKFIFDVISKGAVGPKTSGKNRYHQWYKGVTPSLGASVNALLKAGGFSYQKLT